VAGGVEHENNEASAPSGSSRHIRVFIGTRMFISLRNHQWGNAHQSTPDDWRAGRCYLLLPGSDQAALARKPRRISRGDETT
jgi:hypothetical protein